MNLYPHSIVETVQGTESQHSALFSPTFARSWPRLEVLLRSAVTFEFGVLEPSIAHREYALDLYERGLFKLPYPITAFSITRPSEQLDKGGQRRTVPSLIVASSHDKVEGGFACLICGPTQDRHGRIDGGIPTVVAFNPVVTGKDDLAVKLDTQSIVSADVAKQMWPKKEVMDGRIAQAVTHVMGMTVMLMTRGAQATLTPEPTKLNLLRAKKGRPPIGARYRVAIDPERSHLISLDNDTEVEISGYSRNNPDRECRAGRFGCLQSGFVPMLPVPGPIHELEGTA